MRGLDDALARIARRDELRERNSHTGTPRADEPSSGASPVVDEVAEALRAVVERNPGVFATVVVQEADTAWSVWIGEWDGTLRTRVTRLEPDPPAADPLDQPTQPLAVPSRSAPTAPAAPPEPSSVVPATDEPVAPLPRRRRRPVSAVSQAVAALPAGPSRRPGDASVVELLQPRRPLTDEEIANADTPPLGVRPPAVRTDTAIPLPGRSTPLEPGAPLPKRIPDSGIPLPKRRPTRPSGVDAPARPALPSGQPARPLRLPVEPNRALPAAPLPPPDVPLTAAARPAVPAPTVPPAAAAPPDLPEPAQPHYRPAHQTDHQPGTPALPVPTIPAPPLAAAQRVSGPAMNDRVAGRIADMLRREAKRDNRGKSS